MNHRKWLYGSALALAALVSGMACAIRNAPLQGVDPNEEWRKAQRDVAELLPPVSGDPYAVTMSEFRIETEGSPFYCGETGLHAVILVKGCFRAEPEGNTFGKIRYVPRQGNLRHEGRHAILFALGDDRWSDVGH